MSIYASRAVDLKTHLETLRAILNHLCDTTTPHDIMIKIPMTIQKYQIGVPTNLV